MPNRPGIPESGLNGMAKLLKSDRTNSLFLFSFLLLPNLPTIIILITSYPFMVGNIPQCDPSCLTILSPVSHILLLPEIVATDTLSHYHFSD